MWPGAASRGDVLAALADEDAEFELVVEHLAIARPLHVCAGADDAETVAFVVDRLIVPDLRNLKLGRVARIAADAEQVSLGARLAQMLFEAQEIAHLARLGHGRAQRDVGEAHDVLPAAEQVARLGERGVAGVDEGQHVAEIGRGTAGGQIDGLGLAGHERADVTRARPQVESDEFHGFPLNVGGRGRAPQRDARCGTGPSG